ncbi:hypothetical protein SEUCBS140593_008004 [Sporothrix eucalyptigena]|uniref:Uncharacterized protein n=1 Tax=Sporothrix eucalyptigena TaxID=1812306 RepID=A0ABP0CHV4_9PEZI
MSVAFSISKKKENGKKIRSDADVHRLYKSTLLICTKITYYDYATKLDMPPKSKAKTIVTLDSLAEQHDRDCVWAVTLLWQPPCGNLNQTAAASLLRGTSSGSSAGGEDGDDKQNDDPKDGDYVEDTSGRCVSSESQTTHSAVVVSDDIVEDGARRVEMQLPMSPKLVTPAVHLFTPISKEAASDFHQDLFVTIEDADDIGSKAIVLANLDASIDVIDAGRRLAPELLFDLPEDTLRDDSISYDVGIKRPDEDDNTGGPYAGVDCYLEDALVCGEAEEAAAAAKDKIDALEALDDLSSTVGRPPPIYGTNTRRARCEIQGLRHGTQSPGRASIPASINGKMRTQSPSLKVLLETADRQFVGCLIVDAELGRIAQAMGQLDQTVEEDSAEKDVDDALFHNDFRRLQST